MTSDFERSLIKYTVTNLDNKELLNEHFHLKRILLVQDLNWFCEISSGRIICRWVGTSG